MNNQLDRFKGSRSDYWNTPKEIYENVIQLGYIDYNPAPFPSLWLYTEYELEFNQ